MNRKEMLDLREVGKLFQIVQGELAAFDKGGDNFLSALRALCKSKRRDLLMEYHPDKGGDVEIFKRFQNVYNLLMTCTPDQVIIEAPVRREPVGIFSYTWETGFTVRPRHVFFHTTSQTS
jgi:hypothetical protein